MINDSSVLKPAISPPSEGSKVSVNTVKENQIFVTNQLL